MWASSAAFCSAASPSSNAAVPALNSGSSFCASAAETTSRSYSSPSVVRTWSRSGLVAST